MPDAKRQPCNRKGCRKPCPPGRKSCGRCRGREWAERYPLKYAFRNLRGNAKRRGIPFLLTLAEFEKFAIESEYITHRGRTALGYTIDRIDETRGYEVGNIQVLTNSENVRKENARRRLVKRGLWNPETGQMEFWNTWYKPSPPDEEYPF